MKAEFYKFCIHRKEVKIMRADLIHVLSNSLGFTYDSLLKMSDIELKELYHTTCKVIYK